MKILVFNCGSSSLNYKVFDINNNDFIPVIYGKAHRVGVTGTQGSFIEHYHNGRHQVVQVALPNHRLAAQLILEFLKSKAINLDSVGHRFVHGGNLFRQSVLITPPILIKLESCLPMAPIHNPNSLNVIHICQQTLPGIPEFATFDTAFHSTLPPEAYTYPLPVSLINRYGYRKFGFHGLSYSYVTSTVANLLENKKDELKVIACHLGTGGSSVMAFKNAISIETSMGYSPLSGLIMSTRTGDLDPLIPLFLLETKKLSPQKLESILNKKSGILGISGFSSDLRDIQHRVDQDAYPPAKLASSMVIHRIKKYIGAYAVLMEGLDALIFTDDIGAQNWRLREEVCNDLNWLGIEINNDNNRNCDTGQINFINTPSSKVKVIAMPTDEEWVIANEGYKLLSKENHADF